jgi:Cu+-exporting ATPase
MVDEAQSRKADIQRLADRVSAVFVPVVILFAIATLVTWLLVSGDADRAFTAAVAVLVISCPCALGLATPLAILVGTGRGAQMGILIRGGQVLEDARKVGVVVLDKTGTVTEGRMSVGAVHAPGLDDEQLAELVAVAASAEAGSEHPIGRAIADATTKHRTVSGFRAIPGQGVTATIAGKGRAPSTVVWVGSRRLFDEVPQDLQRKADQVEESGATAVFVGRASAPEPDAMIPVRTPVAAEAVVEVRDTVKAGAAEAVARMKGLGLGVVLLTGDNERSARAIAAEVGIDDVRAEVLPGDKAEVIRTLQAGGRRVAMVGDGINDAPALAQADLGIAIGTGTDVAREASDLTIVSGDPGAAVDAIRLSRRTYATIRGNLAWAFGYNIAAIPLAALGLLNPMIASAAMGGSSLFVVGNSLRLRRFKPRR